MVYRLHDAIAYQMRSFRYRYSGENEGLTALFATIISKQQEKENNAEIMHSHFSECNHTPEL